jgi:aminoglycoside phosphotransferase
MSSSTVANSRAELLEAALGRHVVSSETMPHPYATSHTLLDADIELDDGRLLHAVLKETSKCPPDRPSFVHDPCREIEMYRRILQPSGVWAPQLLGIADSYLVLEHVRGVPLWQCQHELVSRRLGGTLRRLHDALAPSVDAPFLLQFDRAFYGRWFERACSFDPALRRLADAHEFATERLLFAPRLVIHGELYPSNVLICDETELIVDWETAAAGPRVIDLAAVVAGWPAAQAQTLIDAYGEIDEVALDCARFHLAIRWLGWSSQWFPPAEHDHDWQAEADRLAKTLTGAVT